MDPDQLEALLTLPEGPETSAASEHDTASPEALVRAVYETISGPAEAETPRDWSRLRALFLPGARFVLTRWLTPDGGVREELRAWDVEGFIEAAGGFYAESAFYEREVWRRVERFGNIAHVFSAYESRVGSPESDPVSRGVNSVQAVRHGGGGGSLTSSGTWRRRRIPCRRRTSPAANEVSGQPGAGIPIPEESRESRPCMLKRYWLMRSEPDRRWGDGERRRARSVSRVLAALATLVATALPVATDAMAQQMPDARRLGVRLEGEPGPYNAITDVPGVEVGHATILSGDGALVVGEGPVRTGVTAILPRGREAGDSVFAAWFSLNGNGEMTGTTWIDHSGILESPILITNTHSVGVVRDAVITWMKERDPSFLWALPVVAETWDGLLNDINGFHVTAEHAFAALDGARGGPVEQGSVGGGTGMRCHGFKGGIGSASRRVGEHTVGVLVQCNQGARGDLRVAGAPVGELLEEPRECYTDPSVPAELRWDGIPWCDGVGGPPDADGRPESVPEGAGSIIIVLATDAPLLPTQIERLVTRTALGLARIGGMGYNGSGDIFVGFSTANRRAAAERAETVALEVLPNDAINPFIWATVHATEEAILNAMLAAETMIGANGLETPELPEERLQQIMTRLNEALDEGRRNE